MTGAAGSRFMLVLMWCCLPAWACAQQGATIEIRTIGIPPYGIQSGDKAVGIYYEAANLLAEKAGYQSNNYIYPYARIVNELKIGRTDLTIMFKYAELEGYVTYIAPLPALKTVVVGLEGSSFSSVSALEGKTLAYLRGARFSDEIDNNPLIRKWFTEDFTQGARMLLFGRVDAIIGPLTPIANAVASSSNMQALLGEPLVVAERTPWVQLSNKSSARLGVEKLTEIFQDIVVGGELKAIQERYGVNFD